MYHLVWVMHEALFITILLNHYFQDVLGVARVTLNTLVMIVYVIFITHICVTWIFPNMGMNEPTPGGNG